MSELPGELKTVTYLDITHTIVVKNRVEYNEENYGEDSLEEAIAYEKGDDAKDSIWEGLPDMSPEWTTTVDTFTETVITYPETETE